MMKITSREWERISGDYKTITDGQHEILLYDRVHGTCLVPVEIDDIEGLEMGEYTFKEFGISYRAYAYTLEEAKEIALGSGHLVQYMKKLRRVRSLCDPEQVAI